MQQAVEGAGFCKVCVEQKFEVPARHVGQAVLRVVHLMGGRKHWLREQAQHGQAEEQGPNRVE
jgi:hypothetical protein